MKNRFLSVLILLLCAVAACNRDPNVAKKNYVDKGNKFYDNGKYKEALIMYRKALQRDLKYGEAYYRSGLAELALNQLGPAVRDFERTIELQPTNQDAYDKLTSIYLVAYFADKPHRKEVLAELHTMADRYAKHFPGSFADQRIHGYVALFDNDPQGALRFFEKANSIKSNDPDLVMMYMQTLSALNRSDESEKLGYATIEKNPSALAVYDVLYLMYARQNKPDLAEKVLLKKVQNNPKNANVRIQLALHYFTLKNRDQMMAVLSAIEKDPTTFPDAPMIVGDFFMRAGEFDLAGQRYQQGIQQRPKDKRTYQKRMVEVLVRKNRKDEALQLTNDMIKEDPKDSDALALRASLTLLAGNKDQLDSAITDLQTAVSRDPNNWVLHYNLGRALLTKQNMDAARAQFEQSIKLRNDYLPPRLALAQMSFQKGEFGKASQMAQEILLLDEKNVAARLLRSRALVAVGDFKQAREELAKTTAQVPDLPEAKLQVAALDLQDKNFRSAEESFKQIYAQSRDPRAFMGLVESYRAQGQIATAQRLLKEELAKDPQKLEYRVALGNLAASTNDYPTAIAEYKAVLERVPQNAGLWLQLSEAYRRTGDINSALSATRKAQEAAPNNVNAHLQLAMLLETAGQRNQSKPLYEQILKLQPDNAVALNNLAFLMAETGNDLDQALTMAQRARQQRPQDDDVADTLGWIYIKKNIPESAVPIFKELVTKHPERATYRYHLAMALYQKGDKANAKREAEAALKTAGNEAEISKIRDLVSRIG